MNQEYIMLTMKLQKYKSKMLKKIFLLPVLLGFAIITGCVDPQSASDTIPPSVSLYAPATNDTLLYGKNVVIYDASDDQGIAYVELFENGVLKETFAPTQFQLRPEVLWNIDSNRVNQRLSYNIRVVDKGGNATVSAVKSNILVVITKDVPSAPFDLTVRTFSNIINLSWKDTSKFVTGFEIYKSEGSIDNFNLLQTVGPRVNNINDFVPSGGPIAYYRIRAVNNIGKSVFSSIINSLGSSSTTGLQPPSNVVGKAYGMRDVELTWVNSTSEANFFAIERRAQGSTSYSQLATLGPGSTFYRDQSSTLYGGGVFFYRIKIYSSTDSATSQDASVTTWDFDLATPTNLRGSISDTPSVSKLTVVLLWNDNSNQEELHNIERREAGTSAFVEIGTVPADVTTFSDNTVNRNRTYFYRVRNSRQGFFSRYSNEFQITTPN